MTATLRQTLMQQPYASNPSNDAMRGTAQLHRRVSERDNRAQVTVWSPAMPAPLSLRIKEQYMAKRARGLSQQIAADAVGISVRSAQRIDRGELQPEGQQQQRGRHWRTRADPLADVWESVLVPLLEKAPQLEPQTLLLHLERSFPGQESGLIQSLTLAFPVVAASPSPAVP
jgi:hypothetical protein